MESNRTAQLAALAAKAVRIARAAATAGAPGAATEAVKQFLPQLLKIAAVVLIIVSLLSVLIFNAIPHFLFGFPNNNSTDVLDMTAKALSVGNIYDHFDDVSKRETEKLIVKLTENATATSVTTDVRNTNLAWFIAITSVQYNQDLNAMNENTILDMISKKLKYTIENVGNERKISITDMNPSEYMDALNFTPEQRDWAELLFSTMTDNQNVAPDYADYEETAVLDGFVYYNQRDSRWADASYGKSGTIGQAGCGPTALAIAVSNLTGKTVTPVQAADWAYRNGYRVEGSGSSQALIPDGAKHYCLANSREQARIVFGETAAQITASEVLSRNFRVTKTAVFFDKTNGKFEALASDSKTLDGRNVHFGIFDELQEYRDYKLINVISAKTIKRRQPLILYITTLGTVIDGPLMDYYVLGGNILNGNAAVSDRAAERMFVYIDEIDEHDDPEDISCWGKANPSLGVCIDLDDLKDKWERAKGIPAERSHFINKQLNVFTTVDELSFVNVATIRGNNKTLEVEKLPGARCYGGFDLAETEDFTSACLEFPLDGGEFFLIEHSWVPEKKRETDHEKLNWDFLVQSGWLTIVDGDYVDYNLVFEWFLEQRSKYRLESVGYDPAKAFMLVQAMKDKGFQMNEVRQGEFTLTAPLDHLKERLLDGGIIHNNNEMFNWYLGNVKLTKRSQNATYLPTKQNRYRKIDGFAALLNAHTEYLRKNQTYIPPDRRLVTRIRL
ncbi:hypothetical protein FACS189425_04890 [Clostridia bacterium]|nr:hypothetical protein FACS189425_04890 [Clostridia bacterium]